MNRLCLQKLIANGWWRVGGGGGGLVGGDGAGQSATFTPVEEVELEEQQLPATEASVAQNGEGAVEVGS